MATYVKTPDRYLKCPCGLTKAEHYGPKKTMDFKGETITWQQLKCFCGTVRCKTTYRKVKSVE